MSFRLDLRKSVEAIRGLVPGGLDLRPFRVDVVVRTWSGARAGVGTATVTSTRLMNQGQNPKFEQLKTNDVVASGGLYSAGDFRIGPLTPEYPTGGTDHGTLDPSTTTTAREVFYLVRGPGFEDGAWFYRVNDNIKMNFRYEVVVRKTAQAPNIALPD
jgi:hypothetical protein